MNWFDCITLIGSAVTFAYIGYQLFYIQNLESNVAKGEAIPQTLADFPIHQGSLAEYEKSKNKVKSFEDAVLRGEVDSQLIFSQSDINNLYTRGIVLDKFKPGTYLFYMMENDCLIEKTVQWPDPGSPKGIWSRTSEIKFKVDNNSGKIVALRRVAKERGFHFRNEFSSCSVERLPIIIFIFGGSTEPNRLRETTTVDFQKSLSIIKQIRAIEISNSCLIIRNS